MEFDKLLERFPVITYNLLLFAAALCTGLLLSFIIRKIFIFFSRFWLTFVINTIVKHLRGPVNYLIPLLCLNAVIPFMKLQPIYYRSAEKLGEILMAVLVAFLLIRIIKVMEDYFYHKYDLTKADNLKERKVRTQLQFVRKFAISLIVIITAAIVLLSFESMRKIGAGLLTGVGIGSIIIGFAAQKSLGNLLAGFQIAFTQPIRIDDVVIVEGEWGRIEEITLTYVVVSIWDERRLILPITYFIEKPFQNWTRVSAQLLGTVFLYLDYHTPVHLIREEFSRFLQNHRLWDKRVCVVQVTDNKVQSIELRFLMSARSSSAAFDLRCDVREHMITYIRTHYPESLPRTRLEYPEDKDISSK